MQTEKYVARRRGLVGAGVVCGGDGGGACGSGELAVRCFDGGGAVQALPGG